MPYINFPYTPDFQSIPTGVDITLNSANGVTYLEAMSQIGNNCYYRCRAIDIYSVTVGQIAERLKYVIIPAQGNITEFVFAPTIDPNQRQSIINFLLKNKNVIFDGTTILYVNVAPHTKVEYVFHMETISRADFLSAGLVKGDYYKDFFKEYKGGFIK